MIYIITVYSRIDGSDWFFIHVTFVHQDAVGVRLNGLEETDHGYFSACALWGDML